jgi:threonine synthase
MRDIGFCELLRRGEISRLPRLFAVQPENCAPLQATFLTGGTELVVAEGASITKPGRTREGFAAVRRSAGRAVAVSQRGIEAALSNLLDASRAPRGNPTVLVLTGAGLKATQQIGELMGILPEARAWSE